MEALGANGLIAVLAFGLTLSNFPASILTWDCRCR